MTDQLVRETPGSETDWHQAPGVLEGARDLRLSPEVCDLDYWLTHVAQGTLHGLVNGHQPGDVTPAYMREPGPLRDALITEFAFRAIAEDKATRAITHLVSLAPDVPTMEFYATQLLDEARHAAAFKAHLREVGVPADELEATLDRYAGEHRRAVLDPLEEFGLAMIDGPDGFLAGVAILTILVEGVLAPTGELSERKWAVVDPAAAGVERGAGIDEIRHLTVGSEIVRRAVQQDPAAKSIVEGVVAQGNELWATLPVYAVLETREQLFQQGLHSVEGLAEAVGDYEIWPGTRLLDSTPDDRLGAAVTWAAETQAVRLEYMGIGSADA